MKFCKDCDHFIRPHMHIAARCASPDVGVAELPEVFAVHGSAAATCTVARQEGHVCGPEAKFHSTVRSDAIVSWLARFLKRH